jgi:hypothetical protein
MTCFGKNTCNHLKFALGGLSGTFGCNDTCGECTLFQNAFRYRSSKVGKGHEDISGDESDSEVEAAYDDEDALVDKDDIKTFVSDGVGCVDSCLEQEQILEAAGFHIAQAKEVRGYVQAATERAKQCRDNEVPYKDRDYVLACDYEHAAATLWRRAAWKNLLFLRLDNQSVWDC